MNSRSIYAIFGLVIASGVDVVVNLLAAAIQQRAFASQFSSQALWGLGVLAIIGLLIGYWLGERLKLPLSTSSQSTSSGKEETIIITRLGALFSYGKLKGKGIHLSDILLIGSRIDIDASE